MVVVQTASLSRQYLFSFWVIILSSEQSPSRPAIKVYKSPLFDMSSDFLICQATFWYVKRLFDTSSDFLICQATWEWTSSLTEFVCCLHMRQLASVSQLTLSYKLSQARNDFVFAITYVFIRMYYGRRSLPLSWKRGCRRAKTTQSVSCNHSPPPPPPTPRFPRPPRH